MCFIILFNSKYYQNVTDSYRKVMKDDGILCNGFFQRWRNVTVLKKYCIPFHAKGFFINAKYYITS